MFRQIWLGRPRAGQQVTVWVSATTMHVFSGQELLKTHPVLLTEGDLARLMTQGGRPGRPSPATALPLGPLPADAVVVIDRQVTGSGCVNVAGKLIGVGLPLAGKRATLRIDASLMQVIVDGTLDQGRGARQACQLGAVLVQSQFDRGSGGHPFSAADFTAGPGVSEFFQQFLVSAYSLGEVVVIAAVVVDAFGEGGRVERGQQHVADVVVGSGGVGGDTAA
ncbi:UNVERIFIED_ORG: hypothetical protein FHR35_008917 [Microbispora rosea subsp. rosea]